ncbi:ATP-grasp domain-containing protein [Desulfatibacillum aliphaticivorans]|uniref:ATP-grasp domain-containing protein n=1 Tax=Desulfatibacillum aliphaticivorans TaxID=218208 RepID=UPI0003F88280|nr:hypothetical protein [Desulfatibacillum aliphaticivorans]
MIVSLHPHFKGDFGLTLSVKSLSEYQTAGILKNAAAIIVPQSVNQEQYAICRSFTDCIFPNYSNRFGFEGKVGNSLLLNKFGLPHPKTLLFESADDWRRKFPDPDRPPLPRPFVLKNNQGGCGFGIFLITSQDELDTALDFFQKQGGGFVAQEFVDHGGKDLRVVLIGDMVKTYWRCQKTPGEFRNNVGKGALIDREGDPELTAEGVECVKGFKDRTGVNLAAVDVLFDQNKKKPLISEINFVFGRKGVGGVTAFRSMFNAAAVQWLKGKGLRLFH